MNTLKKNFGAATGYNPEVIGSICTRSMKKAQINAKQQINHGLSSNGSRLLNPLN
jgi:hypothetical protein